MNTTLQDFVDGITNLNTDNSNLSANLATTQTSLQTVTQQLTQTQSSLQSTQASLVTTQQQLASTQATLQSAQDSLLASQSQVTQLNGQVNILTSTNIDETRVINLLSVLDNSCQKLEQSVFSTDPNTRTTGVWFQPGNTGNTSGVTSTHGTWSVQPISGQGSLVKVNPGSAFDTFYYGMNIFNGDSPATKYVQVVEFSVSDTDVANAQAFETNFEHCIPGGQRFNHGMQALLGVDKDSVTGATVSNVWRYFDMGAQVWRTSNIVLDRSMFGTGKVVRLINEIQRTSSGMKNVAITINGTRYPIGVVTAPKPSNWGSYIQYGFQIDSTKLATPVSMLLTRSEAYYS